MTSARSCRNVEMKVQEGSRRFKHENDIEKQ
jgi:hypothetical protein